MLDIVKKALRITADAFDDELKQLIAAALADLRIAGVTQAQQEDPLIERAVITYCKLHFGDAGGEYDRLKAAYDEQKAQLSMATGYTDWGDHDV